MKTIIILFIFSFFNIFYQKNSLSIKPEECTPVASLLEKGEQVIFFVYAYHRTQYKRELRISKIFKISYTYSEKPIHHNITIDFGNSFYNYLTNQLLDTSIPQKRITSQNMGVVRCMNMDYLIGHRDGEIKEFQKLERAIYEVNDFDYNSIFQEKEKKVEAYKEQQRAESASKPENFRTGYRHYNPSISPEKSSLIITKVKL